MREVLLTVLAGALMMSGSIADNAFAAPRPLRVLIGTSSRSPYDEHAQGSVLATFNAAVLGQLLTMNSNLEITEGLLESWSWDFANLAYELRLRPDIRFHNGRIAKAEDLEFSLLRGFFSEKRSFYRIYLGNLLGIEKAESAPGFKSGVVEGVQLSGPLSVKVRLKSPNPSFLYALTNPYFSLVPKEAVATDHLTWKTAPIGAGGYRVFKEFSKGLVQLQYTGTDPDVVKHIELSTDASLYPSYDLVLVPAAGVMAGSSQKKYITKLSAAVWSAFFFFVNPLGGDLRFRRAIQLCLRREDLVSGFEELSPAYELLPRHLWGRPDAAKLARPDKGECLRLLKQIEPRLLKQRWKVPVFSGTPMRPSLVARLENLDKQLSEVGIKVDFYPSTEKFPSRKMAEESPFGLSGRVTDLADPLVMFASFRHSSPFIYERPQASDPHFEDLFEKASNAREMEGRITTMRKLSDYLNEQALAVPLIDERLVYSYDPQTIEDLGSQTQSLLFYLDRVRVKQPAKR